MYIVSGIIAVEPSDHDAMVDLIAPLVESTLAEDGNITYGFWANPTQPGEFRIYEEWESEDAMGLHMGTDHMAAFLVGMGDLAVTQTELYQHTASDTKRLM